ncbi:hypothetical protein VTH06DRAFT_3994 [Thermothelomyces fergusii]
MIGPFHSRSGRNTVRQSPASLDDPVPRQGEARGIRSLPLPGIRCPKCAENGEEVWVIPGLLCGRCGAPAPSQDLVDGPGHYDEE